MTLARPAPRLTWKRPGSSRDAAPGSPHSNGAVPGRRLGCPRRARALASAASAVAGSMSSGRHAARSPAMLGWYLAARWREVSHAATEARARQGPGGTDPDGTDLAG